MTTMEQLVDRHVKEYYSRLKHIDELTAQAAVAEDEEHLAELAELKAQRNLLAEYLKELEKLPSQRSVEKPGPMTIWSIVAERLEKLVEKIGK